MSRISEDDAIEVAAEILGLPEDEVEDWEEKVEEKLMETYGLDVETFTNLLRKLTPLCDAARSPLTDTLYRGFSKRSDGVGRWLARVEERVA